jgi:hypothetical protein
MLEENEDTSELDHLEEIFCVVCPANDGTTKVMKPGEQTFDFPATPVAAQNTAVLRRRGAHEFVRRGELYAGSFVDALVQGIAVLPRSPIMSSGASARNRWPRVVRRALFHEAKHWPRARREENHGRLRLP